MLAKLHVFLTGMCDIVRSSLSQIFIKLGVLKSFAIFTVSTRPSDLQLINRVVFL